MAGAGHKLWAAGDVVGATGGTSINSYIQEQVVGVYAASSNRDAAFGGAGEPTLSEGMICWLSDVNQLQVYTGSAWVTIADADHGQPGVYYGTSSRSTALTVTYNGMFNIDTAVNITIDCAVGDVIQYTFDTYVHAAANIAHFLPYTLNGTATVSMLPTAVQTFGPAFWNAADSNSKSYTYTYKTVTADVISDEVTVGLYCNTANVAHQIIDANVGFRATLTNLGPDLS